MSYITPLLPCMSCPVFPMCKSRYNSFGGKTTGMRLFISKTRLSRECSILNNWFEAIDLLDPGPDRRGRIFHEYFQRRQ